jgi:hypothetical protein
MDAWMHGAFESCNHAVMQSCSRAVMQFPKHSFRHSGEADQLQMFLDKMLFCHFFPVLLGRRGRSLEGSCQEGRRFFLFFFAKINLLI